MKQNRCLQTGMFLLIFVLAACVPFASPEGKISQEEAIKEAITACNTPHLCTLGTPEVANIQIVSLNKALDLAEFPDEKPYVQEFLNDPVWYIRLAGKFQVCGGPAAPEDADLAPTPTARVNNAGYVIIFWKTNAQWYYRVNDRGLHRCTAAGERTNHPTLVTTTLRLFDFS